LAMDFLTGRWPFAFVPLGRLRGISLRASDHGQVWGAALKFVDRWLP